VDQLRALKDRGDRLPIHLEELNLLAGIVENIAIFEERVEEALPLPGDSNLVKQLLKQGKVLEAETPCFPKLVQKANQNFAETWKQKAR